MPTETRRPGEIRDATTTELTAEMFCAGSELANQVRLMSSRWPTGRVPEIPPEAAAFLRPWVERWNAAEAGYLARRLRLSWRERLRLLVRGC